MIFYATRTGNARYIASKIESDVAFSIHETEPTQSFLLITYTDQLGKAPEEVMVFLRKHWRLCKGVVVTGNINFGVNFCKAGDVLESCFGTPIVAKLDLRGTQEDYARIQTFYDEKVRAWNSI